MKTLSTVKFLGLFVLVAFLALLPLHFVTIPPMVDFPNHLARCAILAQLPHSAALRALYVPRTDLIPNLAMDAIVVPLSHLISVEAAGRVFCGLILLLMLGGGTLLNYAVSKRLTLWSLAPALLLFNHILVFGFANYLFGIGLQLVGLAVWILMREAKPFRAQVTLTVIVGAIFAIGLFLSHLVAMFLFGVCIAAYEIGAWRQSERNRDDLWKRAVMVGLPFIIPVLMLLASPTKGEASSFNPSSTGDKVDIVMGFLRIDANRLDLIFTYAVALAIGGLFYTKALKIDKRMQWVVLAMTATFLLAPDMFSTCACVDLRIPIAVAFVLFSCAKIAPPLDPRMRRWAGAGVAVLALAFIGRTYQVSRDWRMAEEGSHEVLADLSHLPDKSVVFLAADKDANVFNERGWGPPLVHLAVAETIKRPLFFPQIFALPHQHPLAIRKELRAIEDFQGTEPMWFDDERSLSNDLSDCREEANDLHDIPPSLGIHPHFFVFAITRPEKLNLTSYPAAKLVLSRPRYSLYEITGTEVAMEERERLWRRKPAPHLATRVVSKTSTPVEAKESPLSKL